MCIRDRGVNADMETSREARRSENTVRRSAPVDSELEPKEVRRRNAARNKRQIKLRDTEREFGICRVKEHPLKKRED